MGLSSPHHQDCSFGLRLATGFQLAGQSALFALNSQHLSGFEWGHLQCKQTLRGLGMTVGMGVDVGAPVEFFVFIAFLNISIICLNCFS